MIRIAVAGANGYGWHNIQKLFGLDGHYKVVAVCEPRPLPAEALEACDRRQVRLFQDLGVMLDQMKNSCDVLYLATPIPTHKNLATQALQAGYDVYLEKPPVATVQDLDALSLIEKQSVNRLTVCFQWLHADLTRRLMETLASGLLGEVRQVRAMAGWPRPDAYYQRSRWAGKLRLDDEYVLDGTLNNPLAHLLALALFFAERDPRRLALPRTIQAELYHGHAIESEDTSSVYIMTTGGVEVLMNASLCTAELLPATLEVIADWGTITFYPPDRAIIQKKGEAPLEWENGRDATEQMFIRMAQAREASAPYDIGLDDCRPFTLAVNGAFTSAGAITGIESSHLVDGTIAGLPYPAIAGLDSLLLRAHQEGQTLSRIGAPWTRPGRLISMEGYDRFEGLPAVNE